MYMLDECDYKERNILEETNTHMDKDFYLNKFDSIEYKSVHSIDDRYKLFVFIDFCLSIKIN
jgi:hypothetical protein